MNSNEIKTGKPLAGVRVLDLTQLLPGPMCTLHLADMGAEVIKIEPPIYGDPVRGQPGSKPPVMFLMLNRNKRSVTLDLRSPEGIAIVHRLAKTADVLVEGFRPGVMERLGIGYAALAAINPRLVYCSISGYGQDGPLAQAAGHDINYQALTGVLDQTGVAGGPPAQGNFPIADLAGGALSAAMGILAALFDAQRIGQGRFVDVAMADCLMAHNIIATTAWQAGGMKPVARGQDFLSGGLACYGVYETADARHMALGAVEMKFWRAFCDAVARPDLYDRGHLPGEQGVAARAEVAGIFREHDLAHWQAVFSRVDACCTPVLRVDEAIVQAQVQARGMALEADHPVAGKHLEYAFPVHMSGYALGIPTPAPALGADNAAILAELGVAPAAEAAPALG